jgi:hypothetical protein
VHKKKTFKDKFTNIICRKTKMDSYYFELDERVCFDSKKLISPIDTEYEKHESLLMKQNEFGYILKSIALMNTYEEVMNIPNEANYEKNETYIGSEYVSSDEEYSA